MVTFPAGDWLTVGEAVTLLGVSRRRVQALAETQTVRAIKWGGRLYLDRAAAREWKRTRNPKGGRRPKPKDPA